MAIEVRIPELGENIEGGDVVSVLIQLGDTVKTDQPLLEMETGKATVEIPAPADGIIAEIMVNEGDNKKVGDIIATITSESVVPPTEPAQAPEPAAAPAPVAESAPAAAPAPEPAPVPAAAPSGPVGSIDIVIPALGESIEAGDVVNVMVKAGDQVKKDQSLLEMETGKATVEIPAPADGTITEFSVAEGDKKAVGEVIGKMDAVGTAPAVPAAAPAEAPPAAAPAPAAPEPAKAAAPAAPKLEAVKRGDHVPVPASPSVRKFAREIGINIRQVPGSGPKGRISIDDVKAWSKQQHESRAAGIGGGMAVAAPPLPDFSKYGPVEREKMHTIRKLTVEHMNACWSLVPHVTQHDNADVTDLEALRKSFQPKAEKAGGKLTLTAILIKIMGSALKAHPKFNASIDLESEEIIMKKYIHIGVAVDTPKGLVVPVIRDVDRKNMIEIAVELGQQAEKMREGKISPKELEGGCMTLSNLGGLGGKHFSPIVNLPEVAILGVGRATLQPVWQDGAFVPRMMMPLSLSYDHRLIDGADGTRFLRWVVEAIEQPLLISLEG